MLPQRGPINYNRNFSIWQDAISDDQLIVKMKTKLQAGVPFVWEFHCSVGQNDMVIKQTNKQLNFNYTDLFLFIFRV